jgi:DNA-binding transcriptional ArsR family regulator
VLTFSHIGIRSLGMARAATTSDVFNAVAEPQRRRILTLLKGEERSVGDMARALGLKQPATSKHLRVLDEVGLVYVRQEGKRRIYGLEPRGLQPIHEWTGGFEQYWTETFDRLNTYVMELGEKEDLT